MHLKKFPIIGTIQPAVPTSNQAWVCTSPLNSQEEEEVCAPHSLGISPEMEVTLRTDMNMVTCHGHWMSHRLRMCAYMHAIEYLKIVYEFKWFCPQWPDFIENHAIAPHITGSSELAGVKGLQLQTANKILIHTLPASFPGLLQPSWKKGENFFHLIWKAWNEVNHTYTNLKTVRS